MRGENGGGRGDFEQVVARGDPIHRVFDHAVKIQ
jgi:hypothetical protein